MFNFWEKLLLICKIFIIGLIIALFFWFFYLYFFTEQNIVWQYNFSDEPDHISKLKPWNRTSPILQDESGFYQELKDKIVYFNTDFPQYSKKVFVEIKYIGVPAKADEDIELGIENIKDKYFRKKAQIQKQGDFKIAKAKFEKYKILKKKTTKFIPFDINRQIYTKNQKITFMINFLDWQPARQIKIYEIKIVHQKPKQSLELLLP